MFVLRCLVKPQNSVGRIIFFLNFISCAKILKSIYIHKISEWSYVYVSIFVSDVDEIKRLLRAGLHATEVAKRMNCSSKTIDRTLKRAGTSVKAEKYSDVDDAALTEMMIPYNRDHPQAGILNFEL